ncbi:MAG: SDR family NAD(P)-dependent oxidoreductase [Candidatus Promineifilaceae bacterium]
MDKFQFVALTPFASAEPSLAIAASRAGGLGILNLGGATQSEARAAVARMVRFCKRPTGVRFDGQDRALVDLISAELPPSIQTIILPMADNALIEQYQAEGRQVWLELSNADQASQSADAFLLRADSVEATLDLLKTLQAATPLPCYIQTTINASSLTALYDAGAAGVILSDQLALVRESRLPKAAKQAAANDAATRELAEKGRNVSGVFKLFKTALQKHLEAQGQLIEQVRAVEAKPANIAVIGIDCILPKAKDKQAYWENIVNAVYAIGEIPESRWPIDAYFNEDRKAKDQIYSRWGGFIDDVPFDPLTFGMPPNSLRAIDPMQLLALKVAKLALEDAGYADKETDHSQTGIVLGCSGGLGDVGSAYLARSYLPMIVGEKSAEIINENAWLPEWTEDSFAGLLPNVSAGRVANRMDFGAVNYVVDAACGSSLAAVHLAIKELSNKNADMMVVGGVDTVQSPFGYMCFSKTTALTPRGVPRVFDKDGDGIVISEGVVMLVLKRLDDAERDGDRIYGVLQGASGSSDGKALGLTAPRDVGQIRAFDRVYKQSGIDPTTVGLFEAHGTGTPLGDRTEAHSLGQYLSMHNAPNNRYPLGSVKSMIGHTKAAAGVAGLAKVVMALYHKVLPPTLNVETPNPKSNFNAGPLFINSETRPWIHSADAPRRAAVSAFGFGGTNFHVLAEEYTGNFVEDDPAPTQIRPNELFVFSGYDKNELDFVATLICEAIDKGATPTLADLAYTLWNAFDTQKPAKLAIVAASVSELHDKLKSTLATGPAAKLPKGVFASGQALDGKIAFLFPGQGAQYPNMLRDLTLHFSELREAFEHGDRVLADKFEQPLSLYVFPQPAFDKATREAQASALTATNIAQPALGSADMGAFNLLQSLGLTPDMAAGHSYGEYVALYAAGIIDADTLSCLSAARGRCMVEAGEGRDLGTMAAISAAAETVCEQLNGLENVWLANLNSPKQTIISGTTAGIGTALEKLKAAGLSGRKINVAAAFHSPIVAPAREEFGKCLAAATYGEATFPVYSNTTALPHSADSAEIQQTMCEHLAMPVRWVEQIEAMYADGARIFIESGPRNILSSLTKAIVGNREALIVNIDHPKKDGLHQLHTALAQLIANGVAVDLERLFAGRNVRVHNLRNLVEETKPAKLRATTWWLNGGQVRPMKEAPTVVKPLSAEKLTAVIGATTKAKQQPIEHQTPKTEANTELVTGQRKQTTDNRQRITDNGQQITTHNTPSPHAAAFVEQYQTVMTHFLQTQKEVMLAALGTGQAPATPAPQPQSNGMVYPIYPSVAPVPPPVVQRIVPQKRVVRPPAVVKKAAPQAVPRSLLKWVKMDAPAQSALVFSAETPILITDDELGIAQAIAAKIELAGGTAIVGTPADQQQWGGILHLAPLAGTSAFGDMSLNEWQAVTQRDVKSLLGLAQMINNKTAFFVAAMASKHCPHHGGVSGFMKTAAQEMDSVRVQAVDVDADLTANDIAEQLWAELNATNTTPVVRYVGEQRFVTQQRSVGLGKPDNKQSITNNDVLLITGGARGITAQVALTIAQRSQPTLVLVGRSPLPAAPESKATAGVDEPKALKAAIIADLKARGEKVSLPIVEKQFGRLRKQREMLANLAAIEATGATVRYHATDVRSAMGMRLVVEMTRQEFGEITGVIHGAGIIEDKLIADKSADSFNRVFDTKADSLFILQQLLKPDPLRFMALFSSAAGALGNRGQCDYAAANDLMNHAATHLSRVWDTHVTALCWGPWATEGMVSAELQAQFKAQGIELIDIDSGCAALVQEVEQGSEPVVIYAGGVWGAGETIQHAVFSGEDTNQIPHTAYRRPLFTNFSIERSQGALTVTRTFDVAVDRYLDHHRLDGQPVLPMAVATEWMCEVAQAGWPEMVIVGARDLKVLAGVKFNLDAPQTLQVKAHATSAAQGQFDIHLQLVDTKTRRTHYRAVVEMADDLPVGPVYDNLPSELTPFAKGLVAGYEEWLFHGPLFQAICAVQGGTDKDFVMEIVPSSAELAIFNSTGNWLIDPVVFDAGLQGALLWARERLDVTPIPLGFASIRRYAPLNQTPITAHLQFKRDETTQELSIDIAFIDKNNQLLMQVENVQGQYSSAFNRLGGNETYRPIGYAGKSVGQ